MAIDDNTIYGLTGAQVKDLAQEVKKDRTIVIYLDKTKNYYPGPNDPASGTTNMFYDEENTETVAPDELLAMAPIARFVLGYPNPTYGDSGVYDFFPMSFSTNVDSTNACDIAMSIPTIQLGTNNAVSGISIHGSGSNVLFEYTVTHVQTLATVATTGSYNDLTDQPTIPSGQVNSDWSADSGVAQILNKPSLAAVATSGSYSDLSDKPSIPTVNNATLTIQKNGTNVQTFTANASSNKTANITVPVVTMQTTDPGEGATLAADNFIAVYEV